jgi:hypothetical protein
MAYFSRQVLRNGTGKVHKKHKTEHKKHKSMIAPHIIVHRGEYMPRAQQDRKAFVDTPVSWCNVAKSESGGIL